MQNILEAAQQNILEIAQQHILEAARQNILEAARQNIPNLTQRYSLEKKLNRLMNIKQKLSWLRLRKNLLYL